MAAQSQPKEQDTNISMNHNNISLSTQDPIFDSTSPEKALDERGIKVAYGETALSSRSDAIQGNLLPAFSSSHYSHLPTPQSPIDFAKYIPDLPCSPQSPVSLGSQSYPSLAPVSRGQRLLTSKHFAEGEHVHPHSTFQQCMTPDSSPFVSRTTAPRFSNTATPQYHPSLSNDFGTPTASSSMLTLESPIAALTSSHGPPKRISPPMSSPLVPDRHVTSTLSSPFVAKATISERNPENLTSDISRPHSSSPSHGPVLIEDAFTSLLTSSVPCLNISGIPSISTPPVSPLGPPSSSDLSTVAGGEMERIRQAMMEERLAQVREAESRRPDYFKRAKRALSEVDSNAVEDEEGDRRGDKGLAVGIMESPNKGRRLKLFQETSEESFEESLMAGGYGRYRTADWVRQPQPVALPAGGFSGSSNIVQQLERVQEAPPTEKELKKRKRLAAFRSGIQESGVRTRLVPVQLEGKGRVLLDMPSDEHRDPGSPEPSPSKKRGANRRKKKGAQPTTREKKALASATATLEEVNEKPNWPDTEFPWRLRTEERAEIAKAEEEERLRWIERFLDRDSDDEDDGDSHLGNAQKEDEEVLPPSKWGMVYENDTDRPSPVRIGRGKMVPLLAYPEDTRKAQSKKRSLFPSDPGDARAALLSKKSVRALSYRQQRRQRELDDEHEDGDEVLCICNGTDDGRELVQCDGCQTWYHLQCIGIRNIAELGKEEDPWFCRTCLTRSHSPSSDSEDFDSVMASEPIFVPTDESPHIPRSSDTPFFQPSIQDSPNWHPSRIPETPTRSRSDHPDGNSWVGSSSHGPTTPQRHPHGTYDAFDPTSTPSRGIRFGPSFTTPKNLWSTRVNGLFQTPSRPTVRGSPSKTFGGSGSLSAALDDDGAVGSGGSLGYEAPNRLAAFDDSPVRRNKLNDGSMARQVLRSPTASRSLLPHLEESPVMRSKEKERHQIDMYVRM